MRCREQVSKQRGYAILIPRAVIALPNRSKDEGGQPRGRAPTVQQRPLSIGPPRGSIDRPRRINRSTWPRFRCPPRIARRTQVPPSRRRLRSSARPLRRRRGRATDSPGGRIKKQDAPKLVCCGCSHGMWRGRPRGCGASERTLCFRLIRAPFNRTNPRIVRCSARLSLPVLPAADALCMLCLLILLFDEERGAKEERRPLLLLSSTDVRAPPSRSRRPSRPPVVRLAAGTPSIDRIDTPTKALSPQQSSSGPSTSTRAGGRAARAASLPCVRAWGAVPRPPRGGTGGCVGVQDGLGRGPERSEP